MRAEAASRALCSYISGMPTAPTDKFESWLKPDASGLLCEPGGFHIDPLRPVERAIITHGHSDHARPGHGAVLATPETIAVMKARLGENCAGSFQELRYGETLRIGGASVRLAPAGHILGSAQVVIEHAAAAAPSSPATTSAGPIPPRRRSSWSAATCSSPRPPSACRCSATSPTRARSAACCARSPRFADRTHLIGAYGLGKTQRLIALLRAAGYDRPDLAARRAEGHVRPLRRRSASTSATSGSCQRRAGQTAGRDRALPRRQRSRTAGRAG